MFSIKNLFVVNMLGHRGKHTFFRVNTKPAHYMPSAITRSIRNFLPVENAIGAMVDAICTVVIPTPSKGGRLKMLQDLKVVGEFWSFCIRV